MELPDFKFDKIRIKNFLSFYGNQEANLSPFTAITCCYSEGKEDMLAAIKFALGKNLKKIHGGTPNKLINKVFWGKLENGDEIECFVEITLKSVSEEKMTLYKGVKNGDFIYKVDNKIIFSSFYDSLLTILNINIKRKNVILFKSFFDSVVWGAQKDFEMFFTKLLRMNSHFEEWKKMKEDINYLKKVKDIYVFEEKVEEMKKTHGTIEKFVQYFNHFIKKRDSSGGCVNRISFAQVEEENEEDIFDVDSLQNELHSSLEMFNALQIKESKLLSQLYIYELKISSTNIHLLQERIIKLKEKLKKFESILSCLWAQMKEIENKLKEINNEISINFGNLWDIEQSYYLKNRLTKYGRLIDYIQPFEYIDIFKEIIGESTLHANLCDDMDNAKSYLEHLKAIKYEKREQFIIFKNYPFGFKDFLLGSGEKGIKINKIQEFQIFLCKLKEFGFIETVPIIYTRESQFKFQQEREFRDIIFLESGIFLRSDGTLTYTRNVNTHPKQSKSLVKTVKQSLIQQELIYEEYRDLIFQRLITIQTINILENDIYYFKFHYKKRNNDRPKYDKKPEELSAIYDEYLNYFVEYEREFENAGSEFKEFENLSCMRDEEGTVENSDAWNQKQMEEASAALCKIENEKEKVRGEILNLRKKLRVATAFSHKIWFPPIKKYVLLEHPENISNFYYDIELKKLKNIMSEEEVEEFEGWKDWRKSTINSLEKNMDNFTKLLKNSKINFDNLTEERKQIFSHLLEHCNMNLSAAANLILDASFPFLNLVMNNSEDGLELVSSFTGSKVDTIEISHFNSFLKFIAAMVLFLEIANYEQVPVLFLDNLQEFLPSYKDTFEAVLDESVLNKVLFSYENTNFQIITRIVQYLHFFIKKNGAKPNSKTGPVQLIYFTSEDLVHAADHHIWIRSMFLPDELISSICNSYSVMEEIQFE